MFKNVNISKQEVEAKTDLQKFWKKCDAHDWYFEYSDDGRVWNEGRKSLSELFDEASKDPKKMEMFNAFKNNMFSGPAYGTERPPKPEYPES